MTAPHTPPPPGVSAGASSEPTVGALVHDLTQQVPDLIRSELRLAQAEMAAKGKQAGIGLGMFSAAGLLAFFGFGVLLAAAVAALALVLPTWAAALVVAVVLLAGAAVAGLVGKKKVAAAGPPKPERALEGLKSDIETVKGGHHG
ncbi:phage holin family protein [Nocardioides solisilvae]|uniref:phage holin family protein n=1 Tax=Nocardioides solisilvae TaxID=1542435 RepID=UPI000D74544C|nr:phage holin family protein [Nocardioides solisilvae]